MATVSCLSFLLQSVSGSALTKHDNNCHYLSLYYTIHLHTINISQKKQQKKHICIA